MLYFNGVNELQWKELAERVVKPFTARENCAEGPVCDFIIVTLVGLVQA